MKEPWVARWMRRLFTIPMVVVGAGLWLVLGPLLVVPLAVADRLRPPRRRAAALLMLGAWLASEVIGVIACGLVWFVKPLLGGPRPSRWTRAHVWLQRRWAAALFGAARRLYGMAIRIEGDEHLRPGVGLLGVGLLLVRHTSPIDTLLPVLLLGSRGLSGRFVLKRELRASPCLDLVGSRLVNAFVARGGRDRAADIAAVAGLGADLRPEESVVLFPEGSRFSPDRRLRRLDRLVGDGDPRAEVARELRRTLLPHVGGVVAAVEATRPRPILVVAHTGLEGADTPGAIARGTLADRRVRVAIWPAAPPPEDSYGPDSSQRWKEWLWEEWRRVDRWVSAEGGTHGPGG